MIARWLHNIFLAILFSASVAIEERVWHPPKDTRTPQDIMVDVVNDLGLNILKVHNTNNENNIAISPYGVASILTALLEGTKGRAAIEIQTCGGFPADRDVIRVGIRDIHRILRSYFIPQEGFLSGLSLSSEKVILKPEYQSILRFYGYDLDSFNTPIYPNVDTTTPFDNLTTMTERETTFETSTTQSTTKESKTEEGATEEATTEETTTEKATIMPITISTMNLPSTTTVKEETSTMTTEISNPQSTLVPTTTESETAEEETTKEETTISTTADVGINTPPETTASVPITTALPESTTETTISTQPRTTRSVETTTITAETIATESTIITQQPATETTMNFEFSTIITQGSTLNEETTSTDTVDTTTTESTTLPTTTFGSEMANLESESTTVGPETTTLRMRIGRSLTDYYIARYYDDQASDYNEPINNKHAFLVNNKYQEPHVHFMTYDAVLPFYYVHNLNALALRFPLDSPKYYLLLVLPVDEEGIDKLICDIGNAVTLKQIVSHMRPTYVRAVIPSFMLRGFVILTSSLQKIGIRQIFEPRHTDFSPMTDDKDIYVTNIEQAITVLIKNYMDPTMINKNRNLYQYGPVEFKATHPFLYFVMDSDLDVTLVAGKIVNPINSRIQ